MNLKQALEQIGSATLPGAESAIQSFADIEVRPFAPIVDEQGRLFTLCNGQVLFGTGPKERDTGFRLTCYIVHDTNDADRWHGRGGLAANGGQPCPSSFLRVNLSC